MVRQCDDCGHVSAVVTHRGGRGIDAIQHTDGRPAEGWDGCLD